MIIAWNNNSGNSEKQTPNPQNSKILLISTQNFFQRANRCLICHVTMIKLVCWQQVGNMLQPRFYWFYYRFLSGSTKKRYPPEPCQVMDYLPAVSDGIQHNLTVTSILTCLLGTGGDGWQATLVMHSKFIGSFALSASPRRLTLRRNLLQILYVNIENNRAVL